MIRQPICPICGKSPCDGHPVGMTQTFWQMLKTFEIPGKISGVQEKLHVRFQADPAAPAYLLKVPSITLDYISINEFVTMSIAEKAGLCCAEHETVSVVTLMNPDGVELYASKIFDTSGLLVDGMYFYRGETTQKYDAELLDFFGRLKEAKVSGLGQVFDQVFLSYLVRNGDLHLKNFGFFIRQDGTIEASPAYDLANTSLYDNGEFALSINGKRQLITFDDWEQLANTAGIQDFTERCQRIWKAVSRELDDLEAIGWLDPVFRVMYTESIRPVLCEQAWEFKIPHQNGVLPQEQKTAICLR